MLEKKTKCAGSLVCGVLQSTNGRHVSIPSPRTSPLILVGRVRGVKEILREQVFGPEISPKLDFFRLNY